MPSRTTCERLLAGDRGIMETISFRIIGQGSSKLGDPDLRYSVPESKAGGSIGPLSLLTTGRGRTQPAIQATVSRPAAPAGR
jgi:hypothetical protein